MCSQRTTLDTKRTSRDSPWAWIFPPPTAASLASPKYYCLNKNTAITIEFDRFLFLVDRSVSDECCKFNNEGPAQGPSCAYNATGHRISTILQPSGVTFTYSYDGRHSLVDSSGTGKATDRDGNRGPAVL